MSLGPFVQGDTAPDITAVIKFMENGTLVPLTGASVRFQMRRQDDRRYQVNAPATVVDVGASKVAYSWGPNDLSVPGTFLCQFEVTYPGGRIQTTNPEVEIIVRRQ